MIAESETTSIIGHTCVCKISIVVDIKATCLSEKSDRFLPHGLGITNVSPDDFSERLLGSLKTKTLRITPN